MKYEGAIIRPPSEAYSQLIQVSVGCSHNRCTFCPAYKEKKSRLKDLTKSRRIFWNPQGIHRGDVLIISQARLVQILESIRKHIMGVKSVGTYANAASEKRRGAKYDSSAY